MAIKTRRLRLLGGGILALAGASLLFAEQARTKEYGNPWMDSSLPVFYLGVNYDPEKRGIDDPLVEPA